MTRLDKAALSAILFLLLPLALIAGMGNPRRLEAALLQAEGAGAHGPLTLEFNFPVDSAALQGAFSLEPAGILTLEALSPQRVNLIPSVLLVPGQVYTLQLKPGVYGVNGEAVRAPLSWPVAVRPVRIVFQNVGSNQSELYSAAADGSDLYQLTETRGRVFDFAVSPTGEQIAYSVAKETGGADLWLMSRTGADARRLLNCDYDRCTTPAWSPDERRLAFTRAAAGLSPGSSPGAPRPWLLEIETLQAAPLYADTQMVGHGPLWSPDGRRLSTWDGVAGGIRVHDLQTGQDTLLATQSGGSGSWSPDGSQLLFTRYDSVGGALYTIILRADLTTGDVSVWLDGGGRDAAYGLPAWSPDGRQAAISLRPSDDSPARAIWLAQVDSLSGPSIGGEADWTYGFYSWNAWGTALVLQRSKLGGGYASEIAVYDLSTGSLRIIATQGSWPQWLP